MGSLTEDILSLAEKYSKDGIKKASSEVLLKNSTVFNSVEQIRKYLLDISIEIDKL